MLFSQQFNKMLSLKYFTVIIGHRQYTMLIHVSLGSTYHTQAQISMEVPSDK